MKSWKRSTIVKPGLLHHTSQWVTGGNVPPWFGQTATNHDSVDAGLSGGLWNNQTNWTFCPGVTNRYVETDMVPQKLFKIMK